MKNKDCYLVCDLDETLLKVDFFVETLIRLFLNKPFHLFRIFFYSKGLVDFKIKVLDQKILDRDEIFFLTNTDVINFINENKSRYCKVLLVSASPNEFVNRIASELAVFDEAHGSININLKGEAKLKFIKENNWVPFDYIGDSKYDQIIFNSAKFYLKV